MKLLNFLTCNRFVKACLLATIVTVASSQASHVEILNKSKKIYWAMDSDVANSLRNATCTVKKLPRKLAGEVTGHFAVIYASDQYGSEYLGTLASGFSMRGLNEREYNMYLAQVFQKLRIQRICNN